MPPKNWKAMYVLATVDDEIRAAGSTVDWASWWEELKPRLLARRMVIASFAMERAESNWGYRMVAGISDELDWVDEKMETYARSLNRKAAA